MASMLRITGLAGNAQGGSSRPGLPDCMFVPAPGGEWLVGLGEGPMYAEIFDCTEQ
jgi:hypothetical protein